MKTSLIVALGVGFALTMSGSAFAQNSHVARYARDTGVGTPVDALPSPWSNGGTCVKMCEYDFTPCDPTYWKVADRRCNYNQRGSF